MTHHPAPHPAAQLIYRVRKASGLSIAETVRRAKATYEPGGTPGKHSVSPARLSQIENGYQRRHGEDKPTDLDPGMIAHVAAALGITPERLRSEGAYPEAAAILTELHRRHPPAPAAPQPQAPDPSRSPLAATAGQDVLRIAVDIGQRLLHLERGGTRCEDATGAQVFPRPDEHHAAAAWDGFTAYMWPLEDRIILTAQFIADRRTAAGQGGGEQHAI